MMDIMCSDILFWIKWCFWRVIIYGSLLITEIYFWGKGKVVPPNTNPLLHRSAISLARDIKKGKIKSEDVVQAFIDRIREVNPYINALAEDRFDAALEEAREVDYLIRSKKFSQNQLENDKPLLGVPFTVKLLLRVEGMRNTGGSPLFKDVIAERDAPTVSLIKNAGGIVLATSNAPEFGFICETYNHLYGTTCNPYDTSRTPGGSSGGESALLGSGASVIGLGNDLSGSIRVPAHFTGVFSHKATRGLISNAGSYFTYLPPEISKCLCTGPMCRYAEDLVAMTKVLITDENKSKLNFEAEVDFKKLKIYYSTGIKDFMTVPLDKEINEAMQKAISHFKVTYGATVTELKMPLLNECNMITVHLCLGAAPNLIKFLTLGKIEKVNLYFEAIKSLFKLSKISFGVIAMLLLEKFPNVFNKNLIPYYRQLLDELEVNFDSLLDENTVLIYPSFPLVAPRHSLLTIPLLPNMHYTGIFNFLGVPSTAVPLGLNRKGMPHGIQIIGAKNNDPLTLACAVELSKIFGGWIPPGSK